MMLRNNDILDNKENVDIIPKCITFDTCMFFLSNHSLFSVVFNYLEATVVITMYGLLKSNTYLY